MVERVAEILDRQPKLIKAAFGAFRGRGWPEPQQDWMTPLAFVVISRRTWSGFCSSAVRMRARAIARL
ncbi:hypothetical protein [Ensifer sp. B1-9]|uniref:hypothetical protein n=1 Tax=Ensifer sp. B1-9 TaxID=3141455 RepID=UPI003D217FD7